MDYTATVPVHDVAMLADLANRLVAGAQVALRGGRADLAEILMVEARAVLVSDLVVHVSVPDRAAIGRRARRHVASVLEQRFTSEQRADIEALHLAEVRRGIRDGT